MEDLINAIYEARDNGKEIERIRILSVDLWVEIRAHPKAFQYIQLSPLGTPDRFLGIPVVIQKLDTEDKFQFDYQDQD